MFPSPSQLRQPNKRTTNKREANEGKGARENKNVSNQKRRKSLRTASNAKPNIPAPRNKAIGAVRDVLENLRLVKSAERRRYLTRDEEKKLKAKWRECKTMKQFVRLAKVRPRTAWSLQDHFSQCEETLVDFLTLWADLFVQRVRKLLLKEELSIGIRWESHYSVLCGFQVDDLVFLYVELTKVADGFFFSIDPAWCNEFWLILRRLSPQSKQRVQTMASPSQRLDAWVDYGPVRG